MKNNLFPFYFAVCILLSCENAPPEGIGQTPEGNGPVVVFDLEHKPLPDIPFPNDIAARPDPSSPTGIRINMSLIAPTVLESKIRKEADKMDGFGTFAPIWLSFSKPLDVNPLVERHHNLDFKDDAVFLIDITEGSPSYGKPVFLDMGQGFFQYLLPDPPSYFTYGLYFPYDSHADASNIIYETVDEDVNGNGIMDPGEDLDFDGVLDQPNLLPGGKDQWKDLMNFYEKETNTLILRPVVPLRERTTYAVVITTRVKGENGDSVRSPFPFVNHSRQTSDLRGLKDILSKPEYSLSVKDIAFAWTFTTQSITSTMKAIREGLYGAGSMKYLSDKFPPVYEQYRLKDDKIEGNKYLITVDEIKPFYPMFGGLIPGGDKSGEAMLKSYDYVDYIVAGKFKSPDFLVDKDKYAVPGYPAQDDEVFDVNPETGEARVGEVTVPFICVIPKSNPEFKIKPPFPVVLYMHGTAGSKAIVMGYAGIHARFGLASCAIDGYAHGMPFPKTGLMSADVVKPLLESFGYSYLFDVIYGTRTTDLDMDGNHDPAGDFWTMDALHTRDAIRQTAADLVNFVRIMRKFDGSRKCLTDVTGSGTPALCGDFNGDGTVDIGGLDNDYYAWGVSLGGIVTSVFAGVESALTGAVPMCGGGGLPDVAIRSTQQGVPELVILPLIGPIFTGRPSQSETGLTELLFFLPGVGTTFEKRFALLQDVESCDRVVVKNLDAGTEDYAIVSKDGTFRLQIQADALYATEIRALMGFDPGSAEYAPPEITDTLGLQEKKWPALGDRLVFEISSPDGKLKHHIETFQEDVNFNGIVYKKDAPLVNLFRGFGYKRQTPEVRRFLAISQTLLDAGDPANWAVHFFRDPVIYNIEEDKNIVPGVNPLVLTTVGDTAVPIATGLTIARSAGILDYLDIDSRYGKTGNQVLIDNHVAEGLSKMKHFLVEYEDKNGDIKNKSVMFDPDDLDNSRLFKDCKCSYKNLAEDPGKAYMTTPYGCKDMHGNFCGAGFGEPDLDPPLRVTADTGHGRAGLRILYITPSGSHGMYLMTPAKPFDVETYIINLMSKFFASRGQTITDDPCLKDSSCADIPSM
jgi:hypothetical protein